MGCLRTGYWVPGTAGAAGRGVRYVSTRGGASGRTFEDVLLEGLAPDGGLYVPETWPSLGPPDPAQGYTGSVIRVLEPFVAGSDLLDDLPELVAAAHSSFSHPEVAPLRQVDDRRWLLELFWGPTLSFKDHALQVVGRLFDRSLQRRDRRALVLGATSGDTGSAAIEALADRSAVEVVILYPRGRISEVQRRQMTTVTSSNVHAVAVEGTFDDCQALVKGAFGDSRLREQLGLAAVNSINWARVAVQAGYHWWASAHVPDAAVVVPTGNFGNVLAGWVARRMGAPIAGLVVANNANHGLTELIATGRLPMSPVTPTLAPAMDIQVPSNLERYLFELYGRDAGVITATMADYRRQGALVIDEVHHDRMARELAAGWVDDPQIEETIATAHREHRLLLDPHTAVGWKVASQHEGSPVVVAATAHPAKFPEAVEAATGIVPEPPPQLADLQGKSERIVEMPPDPRSLEDLLRSLSR